MTFFLRYGPLGEAAKLGLTGKNRLWVFADAIASPQTLTSIASNSGTSDFAERMNGTWIIKAVSPTDIDIYAVSTQYLRDYLCLTCEVTVFFI